MKFSFKFCVVSILTAVLARSAEAQFGNNSSVNFFNGLAGSNGSMGNTPAPGSNVIYQMPKAASRIKEPMLIRVGAIVKRMDTQGTCGKNSGGQGQTLIAMFGCVEKEPTEFEMIQIVQVNSNAPDYQTSAIFWFTYTTKDNIIPLLPNNVKKRVERGR